MFKHNQPEQQSLQNAEEIDPNKISCLREYLVDKEIGLTQKELEEIMKGDSIHNIPFQKREEWLKLKSERERQAKIDNLIQKELSKLRVTFEEKIAEQDQEFLQKIEEMKPQKK